METRVDAARATPAPRASSAPRADGLTPNGLGSSELGGNEFLKLLVAQLRNQDPLKPMEDKEFIVQLAQLRSLEVLQSIDQRLASLAGGQSADAVALIGKEVQAQLADKSQVTGTVSEVRLSTGAPKVVVGNQTVELSQVSEIGGSGKNKT